MTSGVVVEGRCGGQSRCRAGGQGAGAWSGVQRRGRVGGGPRALPPPGAGSGSPWMLPGAAPSKRGLCLGRQGACFFPQPGAGTPGQQRIGNKGVGLVGAGASDLTEHFSSGAS